MRLLSIGTLNLPPNDGEDDLSVSARTALVPLKNGSFDQDGSEVVLQAGRMSRRALYVGSDLDGQGDSMNLELLKGRQIVKAKLRDETRIRVTYGKITNIARMMRAGDYECKQPVTFTWSQDWPFWMDNAHVWFFDSGEYFDSGLYFDGNYEQQVITTSPHTFSIAYGGSARGVMGTIVVVPRAASSVSSLRVSNLTNGLDFRFNGTVAASTRLDVDFLTRTVRNNSSDAYSNFEILNPKQVEWMALEPGGNNLRITGSVTGTVDFYWRFADLFL